MSAVDRLKELGLEFPQEFSPGGNYIPFRQCGDVLYFSGQGPRTMSGDWISGTVGEDVTVDQAYEHARGIGLALLAAADKAAGGLERIQVVKIFGMVRAKSDFARHADVINGCSDLLVNVLGERGKHARSAVGMGSLPNGMTVEIEGIMRILPEDSHGLA
jgi:enamine deaminase RidA (YjgF/YER057c/UK114 family)